MEIGKTGTQETQEHACMRIARAPVDDYPAPVPAADGDGDGDGWWICPYFYFCFFFLLLLLLAYRAALGGGLADPQFAGPWLT